MGGAQGEDQYFEGAGSGLFRHGLRGHRQGHHQGRVRNTRRGEDCERVGQPEGEDRVPERGLGHEGVQLPPCGEERQRLLDMF